MFGVYVCAACPLIFRVGGFGYWDCPGREEQVVCYGCGTMHRLIEDQKTCRVVALPGPVRSTDVDAAHPPESAWRLVGRAAGEWRVPEATALIDAIRDPTHGVLQWVKGHW